MLEGMAESIAAEYEERRARFARTFEQGTDRSGQLAMALLVSLGLSLITGYQALWAAKLAWWWVVLPVLAVVVLAIVLTRVRRERIRSLRLLEVYEQGLVRLSGERAQSGHTGEGFREDGHLYDRDLGVLGEESLFGLLATTRTAVGQRALAGMLLHGVTAEEARARQEAVRELAPQLELRERVALLGYSAYEQMPAESFGLWLSQPDAGLAMWMRWVFVALTCGWVALAVVGVMHYVSPGSLPRDVAALLALQGAFALWLKPRVVAELDAAQRLSGQTAILRDGLKILRKEKFEAPLLLSLQAHAEGESKALKSLAASLQLVEQRAKEWYYAPALLLAVGSHAAISLDVWRREHGAAMRRWLAAWAEFEALLAVATYAAEHMENVYPEIVDGVAQFEAEAMAHPLLPRERAVANDVSLGNVARFLLISGSNMAGKSTLLRAMGTNVVLGLAGAPVCARRMKMTALRVGASLALVDSLAEGKSKFLAEVERLRDLVGLARVGSGGGMLFLVDEIFSGTNSADRRVAAEAVVKALVDAGAIGALSTHDLALAEFAESLGGVNVHMASPDESDPLGFDYVLKAGVNRTTNALAIVKMLGLGVAVEE